MSSGADSSHADNPPSGLDSSPGAGTGGPAADEDDSSADASGNPEQDLSADEEDVTEKTPDDVDSISLDDAEDDADSISLATDSGVDPGQQSPEQESSSAGPAETPTEYQPTATGTGPGRGGTYDAAASSESVSADGQPAASAPAALTAEISDPDSPEVSVGALTSSKTIASAVTAPPAPAEPIASDTQATMPPPTSRPDHAASVSEPVTWRAILTEGLSWIGLGALAPDLPVPQFPVPDLISGAWVGLRRLHYAFFNSAPRLNPGAHVQDPGTGVGTGNLGGHDADGDTITYMVTKAPVHGSVHIADGGTYTYIPDTEFARTGGTDSFTVAADDHGPANPWHIRPISDLFAGLSAFLNRLGLTTPPDPSTATITVAQSPAPCGTDGCEAPDAALVPSITVHNSSDKSIWVYNLTKSGDYSIASTFEPVEVPKGSSAPITLAVGTGAVGTPENRIYIVEADKNGNGFTLPVVSPGGVDAFNPTALTADNSFLNYNFLEYFLYPADGGHEYTIDTSYIDEWSLPIQFKFTLNHAQWSGAVDGKTYGFKDYDTVVNQLTAAGGPYQDLVWSGATPWGPQPPSSVSRIIGPDKVWAEQENQPASNVNMNQVGWVPTSYQDFVQYGSHSGAGGATIYPYAQNGTEYSSDGNFNFWKNEVTAPGATPYPMALRTAAILDGFPAANGVYGFFTYPNDETAGQFTNIPTAVSLDIYVHGSSDGASDSVIEGGTWLYSSSSSNIDRAAGKHGRDLMVGSSATDTFILDSLFTSRRKAPVVDVEGEQHDIVVIDKTALADATSFDVDVVDCFWFLGGGFANYDSQFVYERSTGYLYYDEDPDRFGYSGVLAKLRPGSFEPADTVFVL
ncbi:MAG: hypothetical protein K0U84_15725 [Actinomycetia bacterium]|nr:hypothetical protein [Actinomycetes bacterium]